MPTSSPAICRYWLLVAACATLALHQTTAVAEPAAPAPARSGEAVVRQFWNAFNRADWAALDGLVTPNYLHHPPGQSLTLQQLKDGGAWVHQGLANYELTIDDLIQQGDKVAIRWTARGKHVGSFFGEQPTGKEIVVQGMHFHTIVDGKISEDREVIDFDGFKQQLGEH
jgi:steroid delta-isomerase-like uncharacterized protein